jgi:dynein heavy chain
MQDNSWPENAKKEFIAQLHKFNATVTEAAHLVEGLTELYIPKEDLSN